jgi:cyclopropane fatty-acyl-phospholipid synthase-like methyltransferase
MGTSHPEVRPWILNKIKEASVHSILDIGAGSGTYADYLKENNYNCYIDAVEIWQPYIDKFNLASKYKNVYKVDVRDHRDFTYDLVIFGDILEHMSKEDALEVWEAVSLKADHAVIAIPIIHYVQPALNDNPYEEHVKEDWSVQEVLESFPFIEDHFEGSVTGAFWADFR